MISLWKLREKKNVAQMHFVKITPVFKTAEYLKSQAMHHYYEGVKILH